MSTDYLVFNGDEGVASIKILSKELLSRFEAVSLLDDEKKKALQLIIDGVIAKDQIKRLARK